MKKYKIIIFILTGAILCSCSGQKKGEVPEIGFGKADLTMAGIFDDPVSLWIDLFTDQDGFDYIKNNHNLHT